MEKEGLWYLTSAEGEGLGFVYVERRRPDASVFQRRRQRVLVDEAAARRVHEERTFTHAIRH